MREQTRCRLMGYFFRLTARVLLYATSHRQDSTYHGLLLHQHWLERETAQWVHVFHGIQFYYTGTIRAFPMGTKHRLKDKMPSNEVNKSTWRNSKILEYNAGGGEFWGWGGWGGGARTIHVLISTEGSDTPTGSPV